VAVELFAAGVVAVVGGQIEARRLTKVEAVVIARRMAGMSGLGRSARDR